MSSLGAQRAFQLPNSAMYEVDQRVRAFGGMSLFQVEEEEEIIDNSAKRQQCTTRLSNGP
jgi:hypothetical protein